MTTSDLCEFFSNLLIKQNEFFSKNVAKIFDPVHDVCNSYVFLNFLKYVQDQQTILFFSLKKGDSSNHPLGKHTLDVRLFLKSVEQAIQLNSYIKFTDRQKISLALTFTLGIAKQLVADLAIKYNFNWQSFKSGFIACIDPVPAPISGILSKLLAIKRNPGENLPSLYLRCKEMMELLLISHKMLDPTAVNVLVGDLFSLCVNQKFHRSLVDEDKKDLSSLLNLALTFCRREGIIIPDPNELTANITSVLPNTPPMIARVPRKLRRRCYNCGVYNLHIAKFCPMPLTRNSTFDTAIPDSNMN